MSIGNRQNNPENAPSGYLSLRDLLASRFASEEVTSAVRTFQLRATDKMIMMSSIMAIIAVPAFAWSFRDTANMTLMAIGGLMTIVLSALRCIDVTHRRKTNYTGDPAAGIRRVVIQAVLLGVSWSLLLYSVGHGKGGADFTFLVLFHIALICSGSASLAALPPASLGFTSILGALALASIATDVWPLGNIALALLALFLAIIVKNAISQARLIAEHEAASTERIIAERESQVHASQLREDEVREQAEAEARMMKAQSEREREVRDKRNTEMMALAERFEQTVLASSQRVEDAVLALTRFAADLSRSASSIQERNADVARMAIDTRGSVNRVAASAQDVAEAASSIADGAANQAQSTVVARSASRSSDEAINELARRASDIATITELIDGIARQTNLLALNAAIEAARAGDAGQGFAVVAGEVKVLAAKTQAATLEIDGQLKDMQMQVGGAVASIAESTDRMEKVANAAESIARAAAEQQRAITEIGSAAGSAADSAATLETAFTAVAQASGEAGTLSRQVRETADTLQTQAEDLRGAALSFIAHLRAA